MFESIRKSVEAWRRRGVSLLAEQAEFLDTPLFHIQKTTVTLGAILDALLWVLAAFLLSKALQRALSRKIFPRFRIEAGLQYTLLRLTHYALLSIGLTLGLQAIGLDLSSLAFVAGLLSVGIGFGLQHIASNFISGLILLFERPIKVGDRISIGDIHGDVDQINMRSTTILTPDHIAIIVPNSDFITGRVTNWSHDDPRVQFHLRVGVSYHADLERTKALLLQAAMEHPSVMKQPPPQVLLVALGESAVQVELLVWVADPKMGARAQSDLYSQILPLLRANGIEMPLPRQAIYLRRGSEAS